MSRRHVLVSGTPGAWINHGAKYFADLGWAVSWPKQDLDIVEGFRYLSRNFQNIEVQRIHQNFESLNKLSPLATYLPLFYELPYPGPAEFLAQFPGPAVVSGVCVFPLVELWSNYIDTVVDIRASEADDLQAMSQWAGAGVAKKQLELVRKCQLERYTERLSSFAHVYTMTNAEIQDRRFDGLSRFVASVFKE